MEWFKRSRRDGQLGVSAQCECGGKAGQDQNAAGSFGEYQNEANHVEHQVSKDHGVHYVAWTNNYGFIV